MPYFQSYGRLIIPVVCLWAAGMFSRCTKDVGRIKPICNIPETVSFSRDIIPLFQKNCSISGCHNSTSKTGNLNLEINVAYSSLMKSGSGYIDTINPNYSLLYSQMTSASNPMPPTGKLSNCDISLVFSWIEQKARNN
jgi:hypothetical protein